MKRFYRIISIVLAVMMLASLCGCKKASKYSDMENWVFWNEGEDRAADVFVIAPTVDKGESGNRNADIADEHYRSRIIAGLNTQLGLYDGVCTVYSPYYSQATFPDYLELTEEERAPYIEIAYEDVKEAFSYYLKNCDKDKPLVIFGYSQGAEIAVRLVEDFFGKKSNMKRLAAVYAIGYCLTEEEVKKYPQLKIAQSAYDTGVVISYETESEGVAGSVIVPEGKKMISVNPLTWSADTAPADKSLNKGACFIDKEGNVTDEIPGLTGAYIDTKRGTLIATDIDPADYSNKFFPDGVLHLNDLYFFYRNLEENIKTRIEVFLELGTK